MYVSLSNFGNHGGENFMAFFMNLERGGFDRTMVTVGGMKSWARKFSKNLFDNFNYVQAFQIRISLRERKVVGNCFSHSVFNIINFDWTPFVSENSEKEILNDSVYKFY